MKPVCKITFDGLNFEKLLNTLSNQQIPVLKAKKTSKLGCEIVIYALFCEKVVALLRQKCYNNIYVCNLGWLAFWQKCTRHLALFVAICLIAPMLWVSSNFCLRIQVDSTKPTEQVIAQLSVLGVHCGSPMKSINCKSLSNQLASSLGAAYALVDKQGSTLFVKIVDVQSVNPPINLSHPSDVVAAMDGVITRMLVVQGHALVKVGDFVKAGQVLVEGKRVYNDGTFDQVCAVAQVWATVSVTAKVEHQPIQSVLVDTDQIFAYTSVKLANYTTHKAIPYQHFSEVSTRSVNIGGVVVTKHIVREQIYQQVEVPLSQVVHLLKDKALAQATSQANFVVTQVNYQIENNVVAAIVSGSKDIATNK